MRRHFKRLLHLALGIGAAAGTAVGAGNLASAQNLGYRAPDAVPVAWQRFAQLVQYRFGEWLTADDEVAYRFHVFLENRVVTEQGPPERLLVKVWIAPDGQVERVDYAPLGDSQADADLRALLTGGNIGEPPPADMLQPLHLKLALEWRH